MTARVVRAVAAVAVGAAALVPSAAVAAPSPFAMLSPPAQARSAPSYPALSLPAPTGPFATGVVTRHLVDADRADPWVPNRRRELMVSVWYPALPGTGPTAPYVTPAESGLILAQMRITGVPPEILSTTVTHSRVDARRLPKPGGWPLVVLSPGFTLPRSSLTALAEDLASGGYIVAGIDHTYEAAAVTFPDGRITGCLICRTADGEAVSASRARDVSFVLDALHGTYNPHSVAMVGHSMGGSATASTMLTDRRVDVGVNIDGTFHPAVPDNGLGRPFLMLGAEQHGTPGDDDSWTDTWANLTGWRRWLAVTGTDHLSFTDYAPLGDQAGTPIQPLPGVRCLEITRRYVAAVVDRHLRFRFNPLLVGPSPRYSEVVFHDP
jgi:predicted dienelactone hydrolase